MPPYPYTRSRPQHWALYCRESAQTWPYGCRKLLVIFNLDLQYRPKVGFETAKGVKNLHLLASRVKRPGLESYSPVFGPYCIRSSLRRNPLANRLTYNAARIIFEMIRAALYPHAPDRTESLKGRYRA
ncbi:hypothetical protein CROQUDRAFT_100035 [Cronartium quercuum f. sp. fusiforme G11]|uniref:Uncharacterized protein n=1 Tax=Cronartium quercuum f. sp. fusiforme G11 TaxID=708437 RepID=A0A9P6T669_9BASI|nr:hypothetical protein CROQUDRAFT_100035 [Cronartium quercuum f. sp. fusiforme G11]